MTFALPVVLVGGKTFQNGQFIQIPTSYLYMKWEYADKPPDRQGGFFPLNILLTLF